MSSLSGELSGACRVNQTNPTTLSPSTATTWTCFVGNVGFLQQGRVPGDFKTSSHCGELNDVPAWR